MFFFSDACSLQVSPYFETYIKGQTCYVTTVRFEIVENANKILGSSVAKIKYENHVSHLYQSEASIE